MGAFPNLQRPRVIWCGIEGDRPALSLLQEGVETACIQAGFEREDRPISAPSDARDACRAKGICRPSWTILKSLPAPDASFVVDHYRIYRSTLTPRGAIYDVLESIQLRR